MAVPMSVIDGRSETIDVSRALVRQTSENGTAAIDMARAAIERARQILFTPAPNRGAIDSELRRALFELEEFRPDLVQLGEAAKPTT